MSTEKKIQLVAFNLDDLKVLSFLCQDAIFNRDEFFYDRTKNFFAATLTRYCWEKEKSNDQNINFRVVSGLQFKNVNNIEFLNFKSKIPFYNLLAITCNEKNIVLNFSMSAKIKLDCKEINATIEDIDIPWPTKIKPQHN